MKVTSLQEATGRDGEFGTSIIAPNSPEALGSALPLLGSDGSNTYPAANRSVFVPFSLSRRTVTVGVFAVTGSGTVAGNWDVGVYDATMANKIGSLGSTAASGASTVQKGALALTLDRGDFWMAFDASSATGTWFAWAPQPRQLRGYGVYELLSTFPLPSGPVTPTAIANGFIPLFGLYLASTM